MEIDGLHHLVLLVDDLPVAEDYYRELFDLERRFREGYRDGEPGTVPDHLTWPEAIAAGIDPSMSFLGRDGFFLAVAEPDAAPDDGTGRVDHVALSVSPATFEAVAARAEDAGATVEHNAHHHCAFTGRYDVEWELNAKPRPPGRAFAEFDVQ
ncbi:VOC family protein [Haloarchaeobius iranensis]|uniref:Catechol 2,3-dioxygenase n=1 Tax=Haloarchaeobius iranensis TaxID=996166 RepID=A0A1G9T6R6_9EURY|nr:VOC family protein [Haloarchaeobius iranensis]SDM43414.1 Catechol 2,3-dioxygenase [Haloarchaeobius iranensis]